MLKYLKNALDSKHAIIPSHQANASFIDAFTGFARVCGLRSEEDSAASKKFEQAFSKKDHLVFVLVDGMGTTFLPRLPKDAFLRKNFQESLVSVYPSTTACALTSAATLKWPSHHGIQGWWGYLPEKNTYTLPLRMLERTTNRPLSALGIPRQAIFPDASFMESITRNTYVVSNSNLSDSPFSNYFRGKAEQIAYPSIQAACQTIVETLQQATTQSSIYFYINELDKIFHELGNQHPDAMALLNTINECLGAMADAISSVATVVVTADHGHIDVPTKDHIFLDERWPLYPFLRANPCGDTRIMHFFVKDALKSDFQDAFHALYGSSIALITQSEAQELQLFGPSPFSRRAAANFGDFISLCLDPITLIYYPQDEGFPQIDAPYQGHHSGLSPDEIFIPLIIS